MTQPQNGGVAASDVKNGTAGTDGQPQDGGNDIEKQLEEPKFQRHTLCGAFKLEWLRFPC